MAYIKGQLDGKFGLTPLEVSIKEESHSSDWVKNIPNDKVKSETIKDDFVDLDKKEAEDKAAEEELVRQKKK
jgi:hypothetical protein